MQVAISTRHGTLSDEQQSYVQDKVGRLVKYFGRIMSIEVAVDHAKNGWMVEIKASAEHKHDFVATEHATSPEAAVDLCVQKIESQLRRYKDKIQDHKDAMPHGGTSINRPDLPEPPSE